MIRLARDGWAEVSLVNRHPPSWLERVLGSFWRRTGVAVALLGLAFGIAALVNIGAPRWLAWVVLACCVLCFVAIYLYPLTKGMVANLRLGGRAIASVLGRRPASVDELAGRSGTMRVFRFADVAQVGLSVQPDGNHLTVVTFRDGGGLRYESADDVVYQLLSRASLNAQGGRIL